MEKTHWRSHDSRIESFRLTIYGLEKSILELRTKAEELEWYDGLWFLEESEPLYGMSFIAAQNYINSSIYDRYELKEHYLKYRIGDQIEDTGRTRIELIISIANYFKHRDHPKAIYDDTKNVLIDFNLQFGKDIDINDSPIFKAMEIFSKKWEMVELINVCKDWREKIWLEGK